MDTKRQKRIRRHAKIRAKVSGTSTTPRLSVFKSTNCIYAQLVDDAANKTILGISDSKMKGATKTDRAREAGVAMAKAASGKKIESVVFDRGGFIFTGRVKAFAEGARAGGLKF